MTEYNEKEDRVSATNWLSGEKLLHEIDRLSFAYSCLRVLFQPGSNEMELFENASRGFRCHVDYLHDSVRRLVRAK